MTKRSNEPFLWLLFSAGGVVSAMLMPIHAFLFGLAFPLGWLEAPEYERLMALARHPLTRVYLLVFCALPLFHWAHRFRQQLRVAVNFKKNEPWQLLVYDEFFFHLNQTAFTVPGFDQNRVFAGLAYDAKAVRVEFGYLNQYIVRPRDPDNNNHLFSLVFVIKLAPGQKPKPPATLAARGR